MKKKLFIILMLICCFSMIGSIAHAATFSFKFTNLNNQTLSTHQKGNNRQYYKITINQTNPISGISNNMSSTNIFGEKLHRTYSDSIDVYHTFTNYVSNYQIDYKAKMYSSDNIYMVGKKDSTSTSQVELRVSGTFSQ